ncbi:MAG: Ni/Fe hydrogenase subunit alpha [Candidatus Pacebacteria bacterium]|nr:Ni/Fe hydrogenase subunit alpha [Candidatus Paceibacterota bacterium]
MKIVIDHIAKIEGHMGFVGHILKGNVAKAKLEIKEGARLIGGIIIGRNIEDAPLITSRICGVCPVVHNICSLKALENALKIEVSEEVKILRKLLLAGQILQSHSLHLFFLSLPDFFKLDHDIKFVEKFREEAKKANQIRNFSDKLVEAIGGRAIHPTSTKIGGFGRIPNKERLQKLLKESKKVLKNAKDLAKIFQNLNYPKFERKTEFISLSDKKEYAYYEGKINASDAKPIPIKKFLPKIKEIQTPFDVVKRAKYRGRSYMVGALARINNNRDQLNPEAQKLAQESFEEKICYNTFFNIFAQAIEVVHFIEEIQKLLDCYLSKNFKEKEILAPNKILLKTGYGIGVCEAPRGTLFHIYWITKSGKISGCNIITPTAQFLDNLEKDLRAFLPDLKKMKEKERKRKIKMLIRAYDPCISCATH